MGDYFFAIDDAIGSAEPIPDSLGQVNGWGLINAVKLVVGAVACSGDLTWTATPAAQLTVAIDTFINPATFDTDVAGVMADFDPNQS